MPFNGSGVFNPAITFAANTPATADDQNTQDLDIAGGLTGCMTRAGLAAATADQNIGGFKVTNMGAGVASTDAANVGQLAILLPAGFCMPFAGTAAPTGWLVCDGSSITTASQPALFAAIGYTYGGSGANFNLPNAKGNVIAGLDTAGTTLSFATAVGATGGLQTETLTAAQIPAHTHTFSATSGTESAPHTHSYGVAVSGTYNISAGTDFQHLVASSSNTGTESAPHTHSVSGTTGNGTGGGLSHPNVQPTLTMLWCIKT